MYVHIRMCTYTRTYVHMYVHMYVHAVYVRTVCTQVAFREMLYLLGLMAAINSDPISCQLNFHKKGNCLGNKIHCSVMFQGINELLRRSEDFEVL